MAVKGIPLYTLQGPEFTSGSLQNWPAPYLPRYIQKEITLAAGCNRYRLPRMLIRWGQSIMRGKLGQTRMAYPVQSYGDDFGNVIDIGTPRWIVEQLIDPVFIDFSSWDFELQGPMPINGMYRHLMTIQTEAGEYCLPDGRFISELRAMAYNKTNARLLGSHEEVAPEWETKQKIKDMIYEEDIKNAQTRTERKSDIRHFLNQRRRRLFNRNPNEGRALDPYKERKKLERRRIGNV